MNRQLVLFKRLSVGCDEDDDGAVESAQIPQTVAEAADPFIDAADFSVIKGSKNVEFPRRSGRGAKVFKKCSACHKIEDGVNATGPSLYGIVGRPVASAAGFSNYSGGMSAKGGDWTAEELDAFLIKPKAVVADTTMTFPGLKKQGDRVNLIAYLDSLDN
jgi:cytochrome c